MNVAPLVARVLSREEEYVWESQMDAKAEQRATFLRTGSASKVGKSGGQMVGAAVPAPRTAEEILGMPTAASTAALENLTMVEVDENRESRGEATSWLRAEILHCLSTTGTGAM